MAVLESLTVSPPQWRINAEQLRGEGLGYFDFLAATDAGGSWFDVVVHVMATDASRRVLMRTRLAASESIESLVDVFPAAAWHEREAHELLGIDFSGHPDLRPLMISSLDTTPLRRTKPLSARLANAWPGSVEPGVDPDSTRRRRERLAPGVPPEWTSE